MFKNLNIKLTVLIALFIGLAVPMFFTTIYVQNKYVQDLKTEMIKSHEELLRTISSGLSRPMWEFMHENAKSLVQPVFNNENILEIKVIDTKYDNRVFLHLEKGKISNKSDCINPQIITLKENILLDNLKLGFVTMKFSTCKINQQIMQQRDSLWLIMGIQFFISFMILFLLIHLKIITPLKKLIKQTKYLASKKLNKPFVWNQKDEIGLLGRSLEHTRTSLVLLFDKEKESKEKIQDLNKNLELKVKSRTEKLLRLNEELKNSISNLELAQEQLLNSEKMASLGNLVAGISHEINTPVGVGLTAITHFQDITQETTKLYHDDELSQADFEEYLSTSGNLANAIHKNILRASDLIRSFKKISVDQSSENIREFNLLEDTKDFLNSMYGSLLKTNIQIQIDMSSDISLYSCPGSYSQCLLILTKNSMFHAYDEGDTGLITIRAKQIDNYIHLEYFDDGKGMEEKDQKHIFDPFFTTRRGEGGSGLGLNILYNIVITIFKGNVKCISTPKEGTRFIITFPTNL